MMNEKSVFLHMEDYDACKIQVRILHSLKDTIIIIHDKQGGKCLNWGFENCLSESKGIRSLNLTKICDSII